MGGTNDTCASFIEKGEKGCYTDYNKCYSDCMSVEPKKGDRLYCGMGSECDAFCGNWAF